jgi:hypothetical protein
MLVLVSSGPPGEELQPSGAAGEEDGLEDASPPQKGPDSSPSLELVEVMVGPSTMLTMDTKTAAVSRREGFTAAISRRGELTAVCSVRSAEHTRRPEYVRSSDHMKSTEHIRSSEHNKGSQYLRSTEYNRAGQPGQQSQYPASRAGALNREVCFLNFFH